MASVNVRIAGANGDGVESSGALLIKVAARNGLHAFGYRGYQSIIRGGHVWFQVRLGEEKMHSHGDKIDVLVAFNQDAIIHQKSHLRDGGVIIYDPSKASISEDDLSRYTPVRMPMIDMAVSISGDPIMRNVVSIGAVLKLVGVDLKALENVLSSMFSRKGAKVVENNVKAAEAGYNFEGLKTMHPLKGDGKSRYSLDGNTAVSLGAYASGCKFYAGYPMTPASGILHWFAAHENKGVLFKQTEDEIAAINMTIGAANAGVRAMCGTSGGGFCLMVEGLGFAGMLEVPIVVAESQRTGPSTGLPTKTEQADLLFVMHASQGEFPRIVVAPRNVEECFYAASEAFNLAERYQCPVIILLDLYLSEHIETVESFDIDSIKIDRGKLILQGTQGQRFKRYAFTDDGISPRAVPGTAGTEFIAPSDEHNEYGDLVSDAFSGIDEYVEVRRQMHRKRMQKTETMLKNEKAFIPSITNETADYFLVTFGSTSEPALEALGILKEKGVNAGLISFTYLLPLDPQKTKALLQDKRLIDVECNYTAQLAYAIRANTGIEITKKILKYDGEAITAEEIASHALALTKQF